MKHVKLAFFLAIILALGLGPAILFRLYPLEIQGYLLTPLWSLIESLTGFSEQSAIPISILTMFIVTAVTSSALALILMKELLSSTRKG